jgi:natural product biosynthesis luciferase-like monooxygenase protein
VKFGIFSLPTYYPEQDGTLTEFYGHILDLMVDSERLGFDIAWVNEHHFHRYGGMIPSPPVLLAAVAARTTRIRLGTSVALLPLHHPLEQAEAYAMLDRLSGGRLELGIGRGFVKADYDSMRVPYEEGQERLYESLEIILRAWQEQPFSYHGKYYTVENVAVWPTPHQRPHPPIWGAATRSPESFAWFGRRGYGLLTVVYLFPLEDLARLVGIYREAAAAAGHDPATLPVSTHFQVYCAETRAEAREVGSLALHRYHRDVTEARTRGAVTPQVAQGLTYDEAVGGARACMGTPDDCVAILERARDVLGLTNVDCTFYFGGIPYEKARRSFELFAREVMPRLRQQEAALAPTGA